MKIKIGNLIFTETENNKYVYYDYDKSSVTAIKFNPSKEEIPFIDKLDCCYFIYYENNCYLLTGYDKQLNKNFAPVIKF